MTERQADSAFWSGPFSDGSLQIYSSDGYCEEIDADRYSEEYVRRIWGPGEYELRWLPPPGSEIEPRRSWVTIAAPPGASTKRDDMTAAMARKLRELDQRLAALAEGSSEKRDREWEKLLEHQRQQAQQGTQQLVAMLGSFAERQQAAAAEDAQRRAEDHQRALERAQAEQERARERDRAYHQQTLEMLQQTRAQQTDLGQLLSLLPQMREALGPDDDDGVGAQLIQALPGLLSGLGQAGHQAHASRSSAVALPQPQPQARPNPEPQARPNPEPEPEPEPEPDPEADELAAWADYLDTLPDEQLGRVLRAQIETDTVPAAMREPLALAIRQGNIGPMMATADSVDAGELVQRALSSLRDAAQRDQARDTDDRAVGSVAGAPDTVDVDPPHVADAARPGEGEGDPADCGSLQDPSDDPGDGATDPPAGGSTE